MTLKQSHEIILITVDLLLQQFVYKVDVGFGILFMGFLIILTLGIITIGSQTIRAALRNPVDTLRYE